MIIRFFKALTALALVLPVAGHAATVELPKSGQTGCWDVNGAAVVCATDPLANGQDGKLQKGIAWPGPRFVDNANGTLNDNLTCEVNRSTFASPFPPAGTPP